AQSRELRPAAVFLLAVARLPGGETLARVEIPVIDLHRGATERAARPYQLERSKQPPGVLALDDRLRDDVAGHRRGVEAVPAKSARQPDARQELTDLRHPVQRSAQCARPGMFDLDLAELRVDCRDVRLQVRH